VTARPEKSSQKSLARNLGEFFGHIIKAAKSQPTTRKTVSRTVEERQDGNVVFRRTIVDEIEVPPGGELPAPEEAEEQADDRST
jgi:hypothetical protein